MCIYQMPPFSWNSTIIMQSSNNQNVSQPKYGGAETGWWSLKSILLLTRVVSCRVAEQGEMFNHDLKKKKQCMEQSKKEYCIDPLGARVGQVIYLPMQSFSKQNKIHAILKTSCMLADKGFLRSLPRFTAINYARNTCYLILLYSSSFYYDY